MWLVEENTNHGVLLLPNTRQGEEIIWGPGFSATISFRCVAHFRVLSAIQQYPKFIL